MRIELENYSRHSSKDLAWVASEVTQHTSLVAALAFVRRVTRAPVVPTVVTQDEYTHDVTMYLGDNLYLVYGTT